MNFIKFLTTKTFWLQVVLALITTVILVFFVFKWMKSDTKHGETVDVPDLAKLQLDDAEAEMDNRLLRLEVLDSANYNPDFPKYSIIEQNPEPGKKVKEGRKVYIKLNPSGYQKIEMPNLIRHTLRQTIPTLETLGFKVGDTTYKQDIAKDAVLEMYVDDKEIKPGDEVMKTKTVDLVLGDGKPREESNDKKGDTLDTKWDDEPEIDSLEND